MVIILINHITDNPLTLWTPSRFGFSDATEIFVFCSGIASALAFGVIFVRAGWHWGALRILHRVWQVWCVHIGVVIAGVIAMLVLNQTGWFPRDEVGALNLYPLLRNAGGNLLGLVSLTYVPNYFDVLPMYVGVLLMLPILVGLAKIDLRLAFLSSLTLWACAQAGWLNLPAEWWFANGSTRSWFFNPFAWQLVFFTGYAFASGWLPKPVVTREAVWVAAGIVLLSLPFAWYKTIGAFPAIQAWRSDWVMLHDKTNFGLFRYVHFLALAYLAWAWVGAKGERLTATPAMARISRFLVLIGTQSLGVFAVSLILARVLGAFLRLWEFSLAATLTVNVIGIAILWVVAWILGFFKSQPWKAAMRAGELPAEYGMQTEGQGMALGGPKRVEVKA